MPAGPFLRYLRANRHCPSTVLGLTAAFLFQGSSAAAEPAEEQSPAMISFEMNSWGRPLLSWTIGQDGSGIWSKAKPDTATLVVHEITAGPDNYQRLLRTLDTLPTPAPDSQGCDKFMTDQPYGIVRITRGATTTEIAWNAGCMDEPYARFLAVLRSANEMVRAWGEKGRVLREQQVRP